MAKWRGKGDTRASRKRDSETSRLIRACAAFISDTQQDCRHFCVTYNSQMYELQNYLTSQGEDPYSSWLVTLTDRHARARVAVRIGRMASGNLGDVKPVGEGVWEARIDWGPGYRVYSHRLVSD